MDSRNVAEFDLIRGDLQSIRGTITTYLRSALGGAGVSSIGLAALGLVGDDPSETLLGMALVAQAVSVLVLLLLLLLLYKIRSHNRYAGYLQRLADERIEPPASDPGSQIIGWYHAMGFVRKQGEHRDRTRFTLRSAASGIMITVRAMLGGRVPGTSWAFPPYAVGIIGLIWFGFFGTSWVAVVEQPVQWRLGLSVLSLYQGLVWFLVFHRVQRLATGDATIDAYSIRFAEPREQLLRAHLGPGVRVSMALDVAPSPAAPAQPRLPWVVFVGLWSLLAYCMGIAATGSVVGGLVILATFVVVATVGWLW